MSISDLIEEVDDYARRLGLSPATVVSRAVSNGRLYGRFRKGFGCHVATAEKIRSYMRDNPPATSIEISDAVKTPEDAA